VPKLIFELDDLVSPENLGNYLAAHTVLTAVQSSERNANSTYQFDLGEMYRSIIDYINSLPECQCKCKNCCNYEDCGSRRNIENCNIEISVTKRLNIEDCDIEICELKLCNIEDCDINM